MSAILSIIMGVYNGADTLAEAIESIRQQTFSDWECIICDDCSTDNTMALLRSYAEQDSRFTIISNKQNRGLAASLNHCLEYVQGDYIARMDCDDICHPDRFKKQLEFLKGHPEFDLVGTFMQAFDDSGYHDIIEQKILPTKYDLPKGAPFAHATILAKTSVFKELNGYKISKYTVRTEDVDLWYRFFAAGYKGTSIPEPLYFVRMDDAAYKRRKLKYMLHASYIVWYGCDMLNLPFYNKIYCLKPILSWLLPRQAKIALRKWVIK